jgi:hypothetical protein
VYRSVRYIIGVTACLSYLASTVILGMWVRGHFTGFGDDPWGRMDGVDRWHDIPPCNIDCLTGSTDVPKNGLFAFRVSNFE